MSDNFNIQLKKNVINSMLAQVISLSVSVILNLLVPKFIDEYQYANWQAYILYVGYVGILHFGILDGIMLRYAQYDYEDIDKKRLRSQFIFLLSVLSFSSLFLLVIAAVNTGANIRGVLFFVAIGIITKNLFTYVSYLFQITNRINKYVRLILLQRIVFGIGIVVLLVIGVNNFCFYCSADLIGDITAIVYGVVNNKGLFIGKLPHFDVIKTEIIENLKAGIMLLIANWSSMFLIGGAKMIVQWRWSLLTFGKVSFAFSISNLFLVFINAASVVLFPSLKRLEENKLSSMYLKIRRKISPLLFLCLAAYFPGVCFLSFWLPAYEESLKYLGVLMPLIVFSSKVNLLTNNYFKAYRQEKIMLYVNLVSVMISTLVCLICAYFLDNLTLLLWCVVIIIMMRSIVSEMLISKTLNITLIREYLFEAVLTIIFMILVMKSSLVVGCVVYVICFLLYYLITLKMSKGLTTDNR